MLKTFSTTTGHRIRPHVPHPPKAPMAADDTPARRAAKRPSSDRARAWGAWLDPTLTRRGLRNAEFERLLANPSYDSGLISNWRQGKTAPSEAAAWDVADALSLPVPDVLRAAGFPEFAARVERVAGRGVQPPPLDPVLERLDALGVPELTRPLAAEYERDKASLRRRYELELAELRRKLKQGDDDDTDEPRTGTQ